MTQQHNVQNMTEEDIIRILDEERTRRQDTDLTHMGRLRREVTPDVHRWYRRWWAIALVAAALLTACAAIVSNRVVNRYAPLQVACNQTDGKEAVVECADEILHATNR